MKYKKFLICVLICCYLFSLRVCALDTVLRVAVNPNLPPFQMTQEDGKCIGMHIDLMNSIAKRNNYIVDYIAYDTNSACEQALENGQVDLIMGVVLFHQ